MEGADHISVSGCGRGCVWVFGGGGRRALLVMAVAVGTVHRRGMWVSSGNTTGQPTGAFKSDVSRRQWAKRGPAATKRSSNKATRGGDTDDVAAAEP